MSCCIKDAESRTDSAIFGYRYRTLSRLTDYTCPKSCLCDWNKDDRSVYDKMQKNWYVKDIIPHLPSASQQFQSSWK